MPYETQRRAPHLRAAVTSLAFDNSSRLGVEANGAGGAFVAGRALAGQ